MPRVSVIVPVYNGAATVVEAIDGALAQTFKDFDVIVVDDGSTDATPEVLVRYAGQIKVIRQSNRGIAAARNAGVAASGGEYLAFLDCDDIWAQTMLARAVGALEVDPSCVLVYTNLAVVDSAGRKLRDWLVGPAMAHAPTLDEMLARLWPIMPSAVVMRRATFDSCGGFSERFRGYGFEDAYFWMLAREQGSFHYIHDPFVTWRFSLFPRELKVRSGWAEAVKIFRHLVRERYGVDPIALVAARKRANRSIFGYIGLKALNNGDRVLAREAFRRALAADPLRFKNYLRLLRTFLPHELARSLTGRTRNEVESSPHESEGDL